jgi:NADPH-dependent 2,4-dienoyl-CoA reductase/sulfur reductase-like enzyme/nitrite reductase/ring-hydroxylating ferredoxin subunit
MAVSAKTSGPNLKMGVLLTTLEEDKPFLGHFEEESVILIRKGNEVYAVGALCSHYGGPLAEGLVIGESLRCPWHHGVFDIKTGEAEKAPPLKPISCWSTKIEDGIVFVTGRKISETARKPFGQDKVFIIIGAGAAGTNAAVTLRRRGFAGVIHLITEEIELPYDRPNLSKDYLAGKAPDEWMPLWPKDFYEKQNITLDLGVRVRRIEPHKRTVHLSDDRQLVYDRCLLATGGTAIRLPIRGVEKPHVFILRSLQDSRKIIKQCTPGKKAVVIGAGFIGMEAAASLRTRGLEVEIIAPEQLPLQNIMGPPVGKYLKHLHESHGVKFHLGHTVKLIHDNAVILNDGTEIRADLVLIGAGIKPNVKLAEEAGLKLNQGVLVNEYLESSARGIFVAGDIAEFPNPKTKTPIRVEHWEVAERQGQVAALNMIDEHVRFTEVPFFWTQQYDVVLNYVGHSNHFNRLEVYGDVDKNDFTVLYYEEDKVAAALSVGRDHENLMIEDIMSRLEGRKERKAIESLEKEP